MSSMTPHPNGLKTVDKQTRVLPAIQWMVNVFTSQLKTVTARKNFCAPSQFLSSPSRES